MSRSGVRIRILAGSSTLAGSSLSGATQRSTAASVILTAEPGAGVAALAARIACLRTSVIRCIALRGSCIRGSRSRCLCSCLGCRRRLGLKAAGKAGHSLGNGGTAAVLVKAGRNHSDAGLVLGILIIHRTKDNIRVIACQLLHKARCLIGLDQADVAGNIDNYMALRPRWWSQAAGWIPPASPASMALSSPLALPMPIMGDSPCRS